MYRVHICTWVRLKSVAESECDADFNNQGLDALVCLHANTHGVRMRFSFMEWLRRLRWQALFCFPRSFCCPWWRSLKQKNGNGTFLASESAPYFIPTHANIKWHKYLLWTRREVKDGWFDSVSQPDSLSCTVKLMWPEVLTAEQGPPRCHKVFPFHCQFPLFP